MPCVCEQQQPLNTPIATVVATAVPTTAKTNTNKNNTNGANNDDNGGLLEETRKQCQDEQEPFDREFLITDFQLIKDKYAETRLKDLLEAFTAKTLYQDVAKLTEKLLKRHQA